MSAPSTQLLPVARGYADNLGTIVQTDNLTLEGLADLFRQALAIPVAFTFKQLSEARAALDAAKAAHKGAKARGESGAKLGAFQTAVKTARMRIDRMKRTPWVTFGTYSDTTRAAQSLQSVTAFVGDADQGAELQPPLDCLDALDCAYIVHTSTSHECEGLERYRVIIPLAEPIEPPRYPAVWSWFQEQLGNVLDPGAKDPTRLSYMPRTPLGAPGHQVICVADRPWFDASSIPVVAEVLPAVSAAEPVALLTAINAEQEGDLRSALFHPAMLESLAENGEWTEAGYSLLSLGDKGREIWEWLCPQAPNYEPGADVEWWDNHNNYVPKSDFRSIFKKARALGWTNPRLQQVATEADFPAVQVQGGPPVKLQTTPTGKLVSNVNNALTILALQTMVSVVYDEFKAKVLVRWPDDSAHRPLEEEDVTRVQIKLQQSGMDRMPADAVYAAIKLVAKQNIVNSVVDWLNSLKWDGKRRLSKLMSRGFGTPFECYYRRAGRNMLIAMVARAYDPGCQVDEAVVLEGEQGSLKSSALRVIGGEFFAELTASPNSKDFEQQLLGVWLGEFAELNALRRTEDIARIKQFVTNRVDHIRLPYGRAFADLPRRTVLCGSTNEDCWLHDSTGGRRFIPVQVGEIDLQWLTDNREQLFAEAVALYKNKRKWWIYPKAETLAQQETRTPEDPWLSKIRRYLCGRAEIVDLALLLDYLGIPTDRQTRNHQTRVGQILKKLGCGKQQRRRVEGIRQAPWTVPAEFAGQPLTYYVGSAAIDAVPNSDLL